MKTKTLMLSFFFFSYVILNLFACGGSDGSGVPDGDVFPPGVIENQDILDLGWINSTEFGELPAYLKVYKAPASLKGKNAVAYIAVARMDKGAGFKILGNASGYKTPLEFYNSETEKPAVVMNAGYFWDGNTVSLLCRDGEILAPTQPVWKGTLTFYPTRAAFGVGKDGKFQGNWVYVVDNKIYAYPTPAPNNETENPKPEPTASYPEGGVVWNAKDVIGGGPVLVKNSIYQNNWIAELFGDASGIGAESNNPRSAVGITADNRLIFFVCEGRNKTPNVPGYTLEEVAHIMLDLGCVEAVNLDGGGSSCMLINGIETIIPSDKGVQRKVVTAVAIK